jgi:hypothetical protein
MTGSGQLFTGRSTLQQHGERTVCRQHYKKSNCAWHSSSHTNRGWVGWCLYGSKSCLLCQCSLILAALNLVS